MTIDKLYIISIECAAVCVLTLKKKNHETFSAKLTSIYYKYLYYDVSVAVLPQPSPQQK